MGIRLLLLGTAVTVGAALAVPGTAQAEPYPAPEPALELSAGTVVIGNTVEISSTEFGANDEVTIDVVYSAGTAMRHGAATGNVLAAVRVRAPVATVTADANGDFSVTITLTRTGVATITASGSPSGVTATTTVQVLAPGGLPLTGSGSRVTTAMVVGLAAIAIGIVVLWLSIAVRRRGRHSAGDI